jgi:sulfoxide reductase heme-binding subunit YedZ
VIPLHSSYRPLWLGLGALSFDLLVALVITSLVRRRLGYRAWRTVHWAAYASWPVAVLHGLGTGTDAKSGWMLLLTAACLAAVLAAVFVRIARSREPSVRAPAAALAVITPLGLMIFTVVGPLAPHWARRAGTPVALLGSRSAAHAVRVARAPARTPRPAPAPPPPAGTMKYTINGTRHPLRIR